jgi:hypothetical protein
MTLGQLRQETIRTLMAGHRFTLSKEFRVHLSMQTGAAKSKASQVSLELLWSAQDLQSLTLSQIRERMHANEEALNNGVQGTKEQLQQLRSISKFVDAAGKLIGVVAKIVAL